MCFNKLIIKTVVLWLLFCLPVLSHADIIKIGLRAHHGVTKSLLQWQETAKYLTKAIPEHEFVMLPFVELDELMLATERNEFDFVLTNPSSFVEMKLRFGASAIVTLKNKRQGKPYTQFGSVIFSLSDRDDISNIADLENQVVVAVAESAFGGWRVAYREILKQGIDENDFKQLRFSGGIQSEVVNLVADGKADVGVVRTDMLERLAAEKKIKLDQFKVINSMKTEGFPFYHSTQLYPEWSFVKMKQTSEELSKRVALALLEIDGAQNAAIIGRYVGWTVPKNYEPVHELMKELRVGPYTNFNQSLFEKINSEYRFEAVVVMILFLMMTFTGSYFIILNRRLEERVLQRTRDLSLAKERADRASHAKSEFLSKMSHELRTPMNAILGYAQLIEYQSDKLNKKQSKEFISEIIHAGGHLLDLINDLLDVARIESGKYEVEVEPVVLVDIINECIAMVSILADARSIRINNQLTAEDTCSVLIDKRSFKQILINLLSNAIKYNSEHGVVTITAERVNDKYCMLNIIDTGDGISADKLDIVFEEFHRSTERIESEGSGIGLGISRQLIEAMGGELVVESELGKGSKFSLKILSG